MSRRVLFHRDFREYTGGHGKVWDYFNHMRALGWDARVYLTPQSLRDESNPWMQCPELIVPQFNPQDADLLFLAGMDWQAVPNVGSHHPHPNPLPPAGEGEQFGTLPPAGEGEQFEVLPPAGEGVFPSPVYGGGSGSGAFTPSTLTPTLSRQRERGQFGALPPAGEGVFPSPVYGGGSGRGALPSAGEGDNGALPPVINLLQGLRHAQSTAELPLRDFLSCPAYRLCVSQAVADAVQATGQVNGPLRVIPAALDIGVRAPELGQSLQGAVLIGAHKQQKLGTELAQWLQAHGCTVELLMEMLPRAEYLARLSQAAVVVALPLAEEGFFLPGLEAMALGKPLVMPASGGNLQYARDMENCLMPPPDVPALGQAVLRLLGDDCLREQLLQAAHVTALEFTLAAERKALAAALSDWGLM